MPMMPMHGGAMGWPWLLGAAPWSARSGWLVGASCYVPVQLPVRLGGEHLRARHLAQVAATCPSLPGTDAPGRSWYSGMTDGAAIDGLASRPNRGGYARVTLVVHQGRQHRNL